MSSRPFKEVLDRTQVSPLTCLKAQALRDYDTLSMNSVSAVPIGARLIGRMKDIPKDPQNTIRPIFKTVARLVLELFFPAIEIYVNIRRAFRR